jgi:kumamolisin
MAFRSYIKHRHFRHNTAGVSYTPKQLAQIYGFPKGFDGSGQKVAVIELGGGYVQADLDKYFHSLGLTVKPVVFHSIGGAQNAPGDPNGADGEVMLDLCVIGGMAPGAEMHCYMVDNTDAGFLAAIQQATADKMTAISISWGAAENQWSGSSVASFNAAFAAAQAAGVTVTAAAGDNGSGDGEPGQHVDFPSSSPYVLGCGGTSLPSTSPLTETVWNDGSAGGATGGGTSSLFTIPEYQKLSNVPGSTHRGVPDVGGNADPETGWSIVVDGQGMIIGGTSAVAPMWAALAAVLSQAIGKPVGFLNPQLYALKGWSRDITTGTNGTFVARPGYDACTGLGVPIGSALLTALKPVVTPPAPVPVPAPPPPPPPPAPHPTRTIVVTGASLVTVDGKTV